jgi:polar amino acid transport system permease protein
VGRLIEGWLLVERYLPAFLEAARTVLVITVLVILLSWLCGLAGALAKASSLRLLRWPAEFYIWFIRGTPTLIQIFIVYFGLPQLGLRLSPFVAGVLALGVNSGAYVAEIIRGGLLSIPKGQSESAAALGMGYRHTMARIILPQVVRVTLPPITNEAVTTLKNTSLLSTITVVEITMQAQLAISTTFRPFDFYIAAAFLYLVMTTILMQVAAVVERRYALRY